MKKQTVFITAIFAVSTLIQVISNIVLTRLFGTSIEYSHFLAAVTIPTILVSVIYGTLNDSLMPLYGEKLAQDRQNAQRFFSEQLTTLTLFGLIISPFLIIFSRQLMMLVFSSSFLDTATLARMFSLMILAIPFSVFVTTLGMKAYSEKKYLRFPTAQLVGSLANLILVLVLFQNFGAWGLVFSFVLNIIIQIFFVLPEKIEFKLGHIIPTLSLWFPLIVGITALKSDALIIRSFSAQMGEGFLVYQNLISKVCSLSAGLITIGLQVVLLPNIIESLAKKDFIRTQKLVTKAKIVAVLLSLSLVLVIYLLAPFLIKLLFVGGKFSIEDYKKTISLLPYYYLPVAGWGIVSIFVQPLYALKKHLSIGILSLVCLAIAWYVTGYLSTTSISLAISVGLSVLLFGTSLGAEILWQYYFRKASKA